MQLSTGGGRITALLKGKTMNVILKTFNALDKGIDGCWCALWSSKPVQGVKSLLGGFDSHIFPPFLS